MRVVLATSNNGKVIEFKKALNPLHWALFGLDLFPNLQMPEETGATFEDNAILKACFIADATNHVALADDSGLEVEALGGEPGVYSARYGNKSNDVERNLFLLDRLKGIEFRAAKFVSVLVLAYPNGHIEHYRGEVNGEILDGPRGTGGFGYDPLFFVPELGKTFSEMSLEEKQSVSHRGRAFAQLLAAHKDGLPEPDISELG